MDYGHLEDQPSGSSQVIDSHPFPRQVSLEETNPLSLQ